MERCSRQTAPPALGELCPWPALPWPVEAKDKEDHMKAICKILTCLVAIAGGLYLLDRLIGSLGWNSDKKYIVLEDGEDPYESF